MPNFYFLHAPLGRSWPTDDPHHWLLDHRDDDLLAAARERLVLSPEEPDRCLRVLLRRCELVLLHVVNRERVVVRHWSDPAPDLRGWAKNEGFNQPGVQVVLANVKTGTVVVHGDGLDLLVYGERVGGGFPWSEFRERYERRHDHEVDDHDTAWGSVTNFGWEGSPPGRLTWQVLKSIWNAERVSCPNCDHPPLVTSFSWQRGMLSFRSARVVRHCLRCRRRFEADAENPLGWLASMLEPHLRPSHLTLWRRFEIEWTDPAPRLR